MSPVKIRETGEINTIQTVRNKHNNNYVLKNKTYKIYRIGLKYFRYEDTAS